MNSVDIKLGDIHVAPDRHLRAVRDDLVPQLAQSMAEQGLLQPVMVRPREGGGYSLVCGRHRLEAARQLGWSTVAATITDFDEDQAELAGIDENLIRGELSQAERALHVGRRKELYEKLHPETKHGATGRGRKKSRQVGDSNDRFTKDTAKTGQSERDVQRDATRAKSVVVLSEIIRTSLDRGTELDALAKLPPDEQRRLAQRAKAGEKVSARQRVQKTRREGNAVNAKDIALSEFNEKILRLVQMTDGHSPERFAKTSVHASDLSRLGRFLEKVAAAKAMKAEHAQPSDPQHARGSEVVS
jgi:ParB-like chromosome segregation protein Spo0J